MPWASVSFSIAFFLFIPIFCFASQEDQRLDIIYLEEVEKEVFGVDKTENELTFYDYKGAGAIDEPIRCDIDGDPTTPWILGQRIAPICSLSRIEATTKAGTNGLGYKLRAFVSTSSISTSTDPSIICVSELSQEYDQTTYTDITMDFLEPCDMKADIKEYWIYIQAEECEVLGVAYNIPLLARGYNLYNQANNKDSYYDYFRENTRIDDYDLVASFYYASSTYEMTTIKKSEYQAPLVIFLIILIFLYILWKIYFDIKKIL